MAVVTGASRGLGAGLADAFAEAGLALGLCARSEVRVPDGAEATVSRLDVAEPGALDAFATDVVEELGRIDLWVNNAGVLAPVGPLVDADPEEVRAHVATNVTGVLYGTAAFARHVRARPGGGLLVNVSSGAGTNPYAGWAPYCASKAAVDMATRVVALEEAEHGLSALSLHPGVVDTDMQAHIRSMPPERFPSVERFARLKAEERFNSPAWVARYVLEILGGTREPEDLVVRVPDEPR